ncbi:MAG TPA: S-layer protein [Cyanobacteria bacterium UBA11369]|nr:S-layer protein [Cyanobacteria bacterium UBA8553]HAZ45166.1 S-layer protein [Cyanobacteria bacterium UBA11371]HBE36880.1 S-layer protein [Cyanobacteria bacterium UBA11368]HBE50269.1 S-layer protein [Cyanobacteria bacterium UBA11369]
MKRIIPAIAMLIPLCMAIPAQAQNSENTRSNPQTAQAPPTAQQVLAACVANKAETLPIPFTDVSPDHWAFKAVMTMYYCGAFRQATPPALIERLTNVRSEDNAQSEN